MVMSGCSHRVQPPHKKSSRHQKLRFFLVLRGTKAALTHGCDTTTDTCLPIARASHDYLNNHYSMLRPLFGGSSLPFFFCFQMQLLSFLWVVPCTHFSWRIVTSQRALSHLPCILHTIHPLSPLVVARGAVVPFA